MNKSKIALIVSLALGNILVELIFQKTCDNTIKSTKLLKVKKFFRRIKQYRKTRLLVSIFTLLLVNYGKTDSTIKIPNVKPIDLIFSPKNDVNCDDLTEYFDFLGNDRVQEIRRRIYRLVINNNIETGEQSLRISFEISELLRLIGRNKSSVFIALVIRILLIGTLPGVSSMGRIMDALILLYNKGKISSKLLKILLESFFEENGGVMPPEVRELLESLDCVPA